MLFYRLGAFLERRAGVRVALTLGVLLLALGLLLSALSSALSGALRGYLAVAVDGIISKAVNTAALEVLSSGDYAALVRVNRDNSGKIASVETDAARIGKLKTEVALRTLSILSQPENCEVAVPIGSLLGSRLLHGRGPSITARLVAIGAANTAVASSLTSAGINQTLHRMVLEVEVALTIIMPGSREIYRDLRQIVLGETLIVGQTPESYTYIDDTRDGSLDKILDHAGQ